MIKNLKEAIEHARFTAQKLKAEAKSWKACAVVSKGKEKSSECLECAAEHEQLAEWLEELQTRREADRWISVKDKLPEQANQSYLVTVDYGNGIVGACQRFFFGEDIGWNDDCVVAWKPLPKPYESEDK